MKQWNYLNTQSQKHNKFKTDSQDSEFRTYPFFKCLIKRMITIKQRLWNTCIDKINSFKVWRMKPKSPLTSRLVSKNLGWESKSEIVAASSKVIAIWIHWPLQPNIFLLVRFREEKLKIRKILLSCKVNTVIELSCIYYFWLRTRGLIGINQALA